MATVVTGQRMTVIIEHEPPLSPSSVDDVMAMNADDSGDIKNDVIAFSSQSTRMQLNCAPRSSGTSLGLINGGLGLVDDGDVGSGGGWLRTMVGRTAPGAYLLGKLDRFKEQRRESNRRRITEKELRRLNRKIEKLLTRLDDTDVRTADVTVAEEEECVICLSAPATMQTFPCAHRVACRRCFVRTIQTAIVERSLPLKCVVCRSRIVKLNDPMDSSTMSPATHYRLSSKSSTFSTVCDHKISSSSAALPVINPLLARSAVARRADKMATAARSSREVKNNDGRKIMERRMVQASQHR